MFRNRISLFSGLVAGAVIWMAVQPCVAHPQDTSTPKPDESQTAPTTPPTSSAPAAAQAPAQAEAPVPAVQKADKKKPKKVWTNDELKSVKSGVSVVGDADKSGARYTYAREDDGENDKRDVRQQQLEECRNQIRELRERIDAVDKRIAQLKDFKADNTSASGGIDMHQRYNMVPLADQIKQLEDAKKKLQAQIEDIENEARKIGIKPGELR
jgi:DNA-binding transcriptional MerR regulator